jgi:hypothetical protein
VRLKIDENLPVEAAIVLRDAGCLAKYLPAIRSATARWVERARSAAFARTDCAESLAANPRAAGAKISTSSLACFSTIAAAARFGATSSRMNLLSPSVARSTAVEPDSSGIAF